MPFWTSEVADLPIWSPNRVAKEPKWASADCSTCLLAHLKVILD
jgi:hypothetical protein